MFRSLIVLCRGLQDIFDQKNVQLLIFYKFVIVNQNLGLAPDPDTYWIRTRQQAVSGSRPDSAKYMDPDPDSLKTDPKHCL